MMYPLLHIDQLQADFITAAGTTTAVKEISLQVNRGEIVAVVGESGSGKSVTALSILQLLPQPPACYRQGTILFSPDGLQQTDLLKLDQQQLRGIRGNAIAMIFQEPMTSLNPVFTCGDQVMEAIKLHQSSGTETAREQTIRLFEKVKLPSPEQLFHRYPHQLSGGQKQRVMIAMAMSCHPSLLICDEPTTALDATVQKTILQLIKELQEAEGMGVIFITHDLGVAAEIADRALVMYKGNIVEQGTVQEIFHHPQHPYTKALFACRPALHPKGRRLPVVSDFMDDKGKEDQQVIDGLKPTAVPPPLVNDNSVIPGSGPGAVPPREILMKAEHLSVWFPTQKSWLGKPLAYAKAVDDVSLEIYKGETVGLVGESGCGKSTLGRTLLRLIEPGAGKIWYNGIDLTAQRTDELKKLRKDIQIVFQDPYSSLNPRLTIGEAIAEPLKVHGLAKNGRQQKEHVVALLEKVNLQASYYNRYPHEFSGGQRQRIVIARALALHPSFLICDESVSALDVSVQAQVLNLLNDLKKEFGFTIIFISHDLAVVRYISDRIMVMNRGKIVETGDANQVYHHPQMEYTRQLISSIL